MEMIKLNNGVDMPLLGFGVFQITDEKICEASVLNALKTGYRLIDTAACYGNERAVGTAIKKSGIPRDEIFISSKVWIQDAGYESTKKSFAKTLENLQTDYLDLYLVHMPYGNYHGSWDAMEELYRDGKIKAIGVCNFLPDRLVDLILSHNIIPAVNQIELHPFCQHSFHNPHKKNENCGQAHTSLPAVRFPFQPPSVHMYRQALSGCLQLSFQPDL